MRNHKLCGELFQSWRIFPSGAALKSLWMVCGVLSIFLLTPGSAEALPQARGRVELRPRRELWERSSRDLSHLSDSSRREVAERLRAALTGEIAPERQKTLRESLAETPFYEPRTGQLDVLRKNEWGRLGIPERQATDRAQPEYVRWIQESLNRAMQIDLVVDGVLTPGVNEAIREFQRSNGLVPDGIVGPKTERKLSEVAGTTAPATWPHGRFGHRSLLDWLEKNGLEEEARPQVERKTIFLDVTKDWRGRTSVTARSDGDWWFKEAGLPELGEGTKQEISSVKDLEKMVGDANTVVHQGDDLPKEWKELLEDKHDYLRYSRRSPKQGLGEYIRAAELLERRAELGKTRIFDALPQAREASALERELTAMNLKTDELLGWQEHRRRMDALQKETPFPIEPATKDQFLQELREGSNDTVLLIAHHADGKIYFPGGDTLSHAELSDIQREVAPERTLIIISCNVGRVNAFRQSPSEMILARKLALNVIARPDPESALRVQDMLREYLSEQKKINEVFTPRGYLPITENLQNKLSLTVSSLVAAELGPSQCRSDSLGS